MQSNSGKGDLDLTKQCKYFSLSDNDYRSLVLLSEKYNTKKKAPLTVFYQSHSNYVLAPLNDYRVGLLGHMVGHPAFSVNNKESEMVWNMAEDESCVVYVLLRRLREGDCVQHLPISFAGYNDLKIVGYGPSELSDDDNLCFRYWYNQEPANDDKVALNLLSRLEGAYFNGLKVRRVLVGEMEGYRLLSGLTEPTKFSETFSERLIDIKPPHYVIGANKETMRADAQEVKETLMSINIAEDKLPLLVPEGSMISRRRKERAKLLLSIPVVQEYLHSANAKSEPSLLTIPGIVRYLHHSKLPDFIRGVESKLHEFSCDELRAVFAYGAMYLDQAAERRFLSLIDKNKLKKVVQSFSELALWCDSIKPENMSYFIQPFHKFFNEVDTYSCNVILKKLSAAERMYFMQDFLTPEQAKAVMNCRDKSLFSKDDNEVLKKKYLYTEAEWNTRAIFKRMKQTIQSTPYEESVMYPLVETMVGKKSIRVPAAVCDQVEAIKEAKSRQKTFDAALAEVKERGRQAHQEYQTYSYSLKNWTSGKSAKQLYFEKFKDDDTFTREFATPSPK